jgi:hypothetical protein
MGKAALEEPPFSILWRRINKSTRFPESFQGAITVGGQINCDEIVTFAKKDIGGVTKLLDCMFF